MANKKSKVNSSSNKQKASKVETFTSNKSKTKAKSTGKQIDVKNNKTKAHMKRQVTVHLPLLFFLCQYGACGWQQDV